LTGLIARLDEISSQPLEADGEKQANQIEDMEASQGLEFVRPEDSNRIRAALRGMVNGTCSSCANCSAEIAPARQEALPTATTSLNRAPWHPRRPA
jgi:RNA polymerase-binding transcription factor DksA